MENELWFEIVLRVVEFIYGGELLTWGCVIVGIGCSWSLFKDWLKRKNVK